MSGGSHAMSDGSHREGVASNAALWVSEHTPRNMHLLGVNFPPHTASDGQVYNCQNLVANRRIVTYAEATRVMSFPLKNLDNTTPFEAPEGEWQTAWACAKLLNQWRKGCLNEEAKRVLAQSERESCLFRVFVMEEALIARALLWCAVTQTVKPSDVLFNIHLSAKNRFKIMPWTVADTCSRLQQIMAQQAAHGAKEVSVLRTIEVRFRTHTGQKNPMCVGIALLPNDVDGGNLTPADRHWMAIIDPNGIPVVLDVPSYEKIKCRLITTGDAEGMQVATTSSLQSAVGYCHITQIAVERPFGCDPNMLPTMVDRAGSGMIVAQVFGGHNDTPDPRDVKNGVIYGQKPWEIAVKDAGALRRTDGASGVERGWALCFRLSKDRSRWVISLVQYQTNDGQCIVQMLEPTTLEFQELLKLYEDRNDPSQRKPDSWKHLLADGLDKFVWTNREVEAAKSTPAEMACVKVEWAYARSGTLVRIGRASEEHAEYKGKIAHFVANKGNEEKDAVKQKADSRFVYVKIGRPEELGEMIRILHNQTEPVPPDSKHQARAMKPNEFNNALYGFASLVQEATVTEKPAHELTLSDGCMHMYKVGLEVRSLTLVPKQEKITTTISTIGEISGGVMFFCTDVDKDQSETSSHVRGLFRLALVMAKRQKEATINSLMQRGVSFLQTAARVVGVVPGGARKPALGSGGSKHRHNADIRQMEAGGVADESEPDRDEGGAGASMQPVKPQVYHQQVHQVNACWIWHVADSKLPWIRIEHDKNQRYRMACIEPGTDVELHASNLFIAAPREEGGLMRCSNSKMNCFQFQNPELVDKAFEHHGAADAVSSKMARVQCTVKEKWNNRKSVSENDSNRAGKTPLKETLGLPFAPKAACTRCTFMLQMFDQATKGEADAEWPLSRFKGLEVKLKWMLNAQEKYKNLAFGHCTIQLAKVKVQYRHAERGKGESTLSPVALALDKWWDSKNPYKEKLPLSEQHFEVLKKRAAGKRKQPEKPDGDEDMDEAEAGAEPEEPEDQS